MAAEYDATAKVTKRQKGPAGVHPPGLRNILTAQTGSRCRASLLRLDIGRSRSRPLAEHLPLQHLQRILQGTEQGLRRPRVLMARRVQRNELALTCYSRLGV